MNYGQHIDIAIAESNRRINLLKLPSGTDWGCNPKTIMRIYKTYVRPVLEYGAIVMISAAQVHLEKLQKVQNKALRIAFKKPIHTRITDLHEMAGIEPIRERLQTLSNKFVHSLEENSELFKLQKELNEIFKKRDTTSYLDKLMEHYKEAKQLKLQQYVNITLDQRSTSSNVFTATA